MAPDQAHDTAALREVTIAELNRAPSRVLRGVETSERLVISRYGEPVAMVSSIDHALMSLLATADEFVAIRVEAEGEMERGEAPLLTPHSRSLRAGLRADAELRSLSGRHRVSVRQALAERLAEVRMAPALLQVRVGSRFIVGCSLTGEPPALLVYAVRSRAELLERLVGSRIVERQRRRRWDRILHGRDPRFRLGPQG